MTRRARSAKRLAPGLFACGLLAACGAAPSGAPPAGGTTGASSARGVDLDAPYATELVSFEPGEGAGFGEDRLPDVVLGPPSGIAGQGSLDVLSLGKGGSIELTFDRYDIVDGEGADLVVFENPFWPGGDPKAVFAEPGEVSVSEDGVDWRTFPCDVTGDGAGHYPGCAGVTPTLEYDATAVVPLEPSVTGGDTFDLGDVGLARAHFVRIRDVSLAGSAPTAGFDLDAVGIVHAERLDEAP